MDNDNRFQEWIETEEMSPRLRNILRFLQATFHLNSPFDLNEKLFLSKKNAGKAMWKEFNEVIKKWNGCDENSNEFCPPLGGQNPT